MNNKLTYEMFHPGELATLPAAIERVRGEYAVGEWWTGHRLIAGDELAAIERRMRARGEIVTDETIGGDRRRGQLTVIRGGRP